VVASEEPDTKLAALSVLLIEDSEVCRLVMDERLQSFGYQVATAPDAVSSIALASTQKTDIAIVDIGLPGMDGYAIAAQLRKMPATAHLRLIALTGYGQDMDLQRAREPGFDIHLLKPVDSDILLQAMQLPVPTPGLAADVNQE
jgi:CheY-like chemotaxis protein